MSCPSIPSAILPAEEWIGDGPLLRFPFIGPVPLHAFRQFVAGVSFVLLLAAIGIDLVHPFDLVPGFEELPVYQALIIGCLLLSLPQIVAQLRFNALRANAVSCLVLVLVAMAAVSHLAHGKVYDARQSAAAVGKVALLYFAVISLVASPARLRILLAAVAAFVLAMTVVAVLQYYGFVDLQGIEHVERHTVDAAAGGVDIVVRLCGIGLFNDPNDLSMALVMTLIVCGYFLNDPAFRLGNRILLLAPAVLCVYGIYLTHSRGGMVAALAGLVAFVGARFGRRNGLLLVCLLLPLLIVAASRGGSDGVDLVDNPEDTFQGRLMLWSESFDVLRSAPIVGIGHERLVEEIGMVSHNSYVHAFAELGLVGGIAFVGTFYLVLQGIRRMRPVDPELARMRPYMLALIAAYAAGLLSLSRCYKVPTILMVAIGTAYLAVASREGPSVLPRSDWPCVRRITGVGLFLLAATYLFVRVMLRRGAS
jgi:O-antigen ligase